MTAQILIDILDRNGVHGFMLVRSDNGSIFSVVYLEENRFDGTQLRFWSFNDDGTLYNTSSIPAPNGEMDLLAEYAEDAELYNENDGLPTFRCVWC